MAVWFHGGMKPMDCDAIPQAITAPLACQSEGQSRSQPSGRDKDKQLGQARPSLSEHMKRNESKPLA